MMFSPNKTYGLSKTDEQEQMKGTILALSAELGKNKDVNLKLARTLQSNKGPNKCSNNQKGKGKGRGEGKYNESKWEQKQVTPKDSELKMKFNDDTYHCCNSHQCGPWHLPACCKWNKEFEAEQQQSNSKDNSSQSNPTNDEAFVGDKTGKVRKWLQR
jgi:hypothetical protein